jgi:hypothetical protein
MLAAHHGKLLIADFLLSIYSDIDISMRDKWGRTALNYACEHGHLEVVKLLIHHGIDVSSDTSLVSTDNHACFCFVYINLTFQKGMTALMHAASGGHLETVKYLVESCGCSPFVQCEVRKHKAVSSATKVYV